jgi:hypothetical protein
MNREQTLAMQPGRELDALVAEKVMGLCVLDSVNMYGDGCVVSDAGMDEWEKHREYGKVDDPDLLEPYSTHIAAAWEVVEKMKATHICKVVGLSSTGEWFASIKPKEAGIFSSHAYAPTAPEAICKAAILAVMEE